MNNAESIEQKYRELQVKHKQLLEQNALEKSRFQSQAEHYQSQTEQYQSQVEKH